MLLLCYTTDKENNTDTFLNSRPVGTKCRKILYLLPLFYMDSWIFHWNLEPLMWSKPDIVIVAGLNSNCCHWSGAKICWHCNILTSVLSCRYMVLGRHIGAEERAESMIAICNNSDYIFIKFKRIFNFCGHSVDICFVLQQVTVKFLTNRRIQWRILRIGNRHHNFAPGTSLLGVSPWRRALAFKGFMSTRLKVNRFWFHLLRNLQIPVQGSTELLLISDAIMVWHQVSTANTQQLKNRQDHSYPW